MTELANVNNIMDISVSGYKFSNWITNFQTKFRQPNGNYDYMAYLSNMKNKASFFMIVGRIGEEEGNLFLNKLLTPAINDITVIERKSQTGGGGGFLIFIALTLLFIGNINLSNNILDEEITIFNTITGFHKNKFSYQAIELEILKQNVILYGFGAIAGFFILHLYFKNAKNIPIGKWLIETDELKSQIDAMLKVGDIITINTRTGIEYFTTSDKIDYLLEVYNYTMELNSIAYRKSVEGVILDTWGKERELYWPDFLAKSEYPNGPIKRLRYPPRLKDKEEQEWWTQGKYIPIGYKPSKEEIEEDYRLSDPRYIQKINTPKYSQETYRKEFERSMNQGPYLTRRL